jgi:hypothetical protein
MIHMPTPLRIAEQMFSMMEASTMVVMPGKVGNLLLELILPVLFFVLLVNNSLGFASYGLVISPEHR